SGFISARQLSEDSRTVLNIRTQKEFAEDEDAGQKTDEEVSSVWSRHKITRTPKLLNSLVKPQSADPFESYPVPAEPYFAQVLHHMPGFIIRGWRAMATTKEERSAGLSWVQRLAMSDPAYFYVNLLSAADDLVQKGLMDARVQIWLTSLTVGAINSALSDSRTALTPGLILSVGRIAFREIVVGDRTAGEAIHRPAFAKMLTMVGGLDALRMPSMCYRHLLWADRILTAITGIAIADLEGSGLNERRVTTVEDDVKALDGFLPQRQRRSGIL
ncbi:MAG: hypothetical protein FE78DRAFT_304331, partial [Acidomyces sp. 'richmondensis']